MVEIIILILGALLGIVISYLCLRRRLVSTQLRDEKTAQENSMLHDENIQLLE